MTARLAILLAAWAFLGPRTLCLAGALPCGCEGHTSPALELAAEHHATESPCGCPEERDSHHGSDCHADPCSEAFTRGERLDEYSQLVTDSAAFTLPVDRDRCPHLLFAAGLPQHARDDGLIALHPSDLPLLI